MDEEGIGESNNIPMFFNKHCRKYSNIHVSAAYFTLEKLRDNQQREFIKWEQESARYYEPEKLNK